MACLCETSPGSVSRSYGYDTKGRVDNISETIPGSTAFSTTFTYDNKGRLDTRTHPSGIVETSNYNNYGYLASVSAGGATRYTVTAMNARQQITTATYGASLQGVYGYNVYGDALHSKAHVSGNYKQDYRYVYSAINQEIFVRTLESRQNYLRNKIETFAYDKLDRLDSITGPQNLIMDYDAKGNITKKSDIGSVFGYNHPTKPYALTGIETSSGAVSDILQTVGYTSFEQPVVIAEGSCQATFAYNSDGQRAKMTVVQSGSTALTRWYAGSRYSKETAGSTTKEYTWIGGDAYSAPCLAVKQSGTTTYYYLLRDNLGTITHVTDASGNVVSEYSFDAWGRRRDKDDWSYTLSGEPALFADRGFTGHEWLPWFNLYNMNGRLYDPVVGRFLSPDPIIADQTNTQEYNRYSYCLNNPLKYTDPSGCKKVAKKEGLDWDYLNYLNNRFRPRGSFSGGGGYGGYGGAPGQGKNGDGLNGIYYDWYSGSYRSTEDDNYNVGRDYALNVVSSYGETYKYGNLGGYCLDDSNCAYVRGFYSSSTGITPIVTDFDPGAEGAVNFYVKIGTWTLNMPSGSGDGFNIWRDISNSFLVGAAANQPTYFRSSQIAKEGKFAVDGWKTYSNAFKGNQYVSSASVKEAKAAFSSVVKTTGRISTGLTLVSFGVTYANYAAGNVSEGRYNVQQTINAIGLFGPWGAGIAIGLGTVDSIWGDQIEYWIRH